VPCPASVEGDAPGPYPGEDRSSRSWGSATSNVRGGSLPAPDDFQLLGKRREGVNAAARKGRDEEETSMSIAAGEIGRAHV